MERFTYPPSSITVGRLLVGFLSALDLSLTIIYILVYVFWSAPPAFYIYMILFQLFHVFSWSTILTLSSSMYSLTYSTFVLVVFILAFFSDLISFLVRAVVFGDCSYGSCGVNTAMSRTTLFLVLSYLVVDIVVILAVCFVFLASQDFVFIMKQRLLFVCGSNELLNKIYTVPRQALFFRSLLGAVLQFDLWITVGIVILLLLGFGLTTDFLYVLIFLIPHYFMWCIGRGVAGTSGFIPTDAMYDPDNIFVVLCGYIAMALIDIGGIAFSFWVISPCLSSSSTCTVAEIILNALLVTMYIVLGAFSFLQSICIFVIEYEIRWSSLELAAHRKEIIRQDNDITEYMSRKRQIAEKDDLTKKTD